MQAAKLHDSDPMPFELALRIRHPSMDPAVISDELQLESHHSFKAGQPRQVHTNLAAPSYHAESYWLGTLDIATLYPTLPTLDMPMTDQPGMEVAKERAQAMITRDLDSALSWCTRFLLRAHADFLRRIRVEGGQVHLLVTLSDSSTAGFTLPPELTRTLCDIGVTLNFEFSFKD